MKEPQYKPEQWVVYAFEDGTGGFGRIVGAYFNGSDWNYTIHGTNLDTTYVSATTEEITYFYENGSWLEPQHAGVGRASVYTDQPPAS